MSRDDIDAPALGEAWLQGVLLHAVNEVKINQIITATGPPGSGKSWAGIRICELVDSGFSIDRVILPGLEAALNSMKAITDEEMGFGSAIVLDDVGLMIPARDFWTLLNKGFGLIAQSSRYLRKIVWSTVPDQHFIDSQPRKLTNYHFEFVPRKKDDSPAIARVYEVQSNPRSGKIYYKHPEVTPGKYLESMTFKMPSPMMIEAYEMKKKSSMNLFYRETIDDLEGGKIPDDGYHYRMIMLIQRYGGMLGKTDKAIAGDLGIHPKAFSRALRKAKQRLIPEQGVASEVQTPTNGDKAT